jgi:hypothetical protein
MEAVLISIIPDPATRSDVIASWLLFRFVYYIAPLFVSLTALGCYEAVLHWRANRAAGPREAADDDKHPSIPCSPLTSQERGRG